MGCAGSIHRVDRPGGRHPVGGLRLPTDEQMRQYAIREFDRNYINFTNVDLSDRQNCHLNEDDIRHGWLHISDYADLAAALEHDHVSRMEVHAVDKSRDALDVSDMLDAITMFVATRAYGRVHKDNDRQVELCFRYSFQLVDPEQYVSCGFVKHDRDYNIYWFNRGEPTATKFAGKK